MKNTRILISALIVLLVCVCLALVGLAGVYLIGRTGGFSTNQGLPDVTTERPGSVNADDPDGMDPLNSAVLAEMDEIQKQVIGIRGLEANGIFTRALFSPTELQTRVEEDFFEDYSAEEAGEDAIVLSAFGLLEPEFDLLGLYIALFSEQVAGFYDNETKEMVVVQSEEFKGPERLTYAHEYAHALQDQNFDIKEGLGYDDENCEEDSERCAAIQALLEGDATLTELEWVQTYGTRDDILEIQEFYSSLESPVYESAPAFLREDFVFPYVDGFEFVQFLFDRGGWQAVTDAYAAPPVSTEQILHPESYPADVPIDVELPDLVPLLGDSWVLLDQNVMGEWYTYLILAAGVDPTSRITETRARAAAAGWGGDRYAVYYEGDTESLVMVFVQDWDSGEDAQEYANAFLEYGNLRFGPPSEQDPAKMLWMGESAHLFVLDGNTTIWVAAPDPDLAETIRNQIP